MGDGEIYREGRREEDEAEREGVREGETHFFFSSGWELVQACDLSTRKIEKGG